MQQPYTREREDYRAERVEYRRNANRRSRQQLSDTNRNLNQLNNRIRMQIRRSLTLSSFDRIAFNYDPEIDYAAHSKINIGKMDKECKYCHALKFKNETVGMCCCSGKVDLPKLNPPPEPLKTLMKGETAESKLFLKKIRKFNQCFQMTSFRANEIDSSHTDHNLKFKAKCIIKLDLYLQYLTNLQNFYKFILWEMKKIK